MITKRVSVIRELLKPEANNSNDKNSNELNYERQSARHLRKKEYLAAERYFGFILEEIALAVSSGLDVLPAISQVVKVNNKIIASEPDCYGLMIANRLLAEIIELSQHGFEFQAAIRQVLNTKATENMLVALMHLAMAHKIGGDLVRPLQDISDSFQEQLQEQQDQMIQTIPIKATFPLLLIFAGMIIVSISVPILKVIESTKSNVIKEAY